MANKDVYNDPNLNKTSREISLVTDNRKISDAAAEFQRISIHADHLAANDGVLFSDKRRFRYTHVNRKGINKAKNHFQGIQRLRKGKYLVISGGDGTEPASHVFVIKMETRISTGPWGSNLLMSNRPKESDNIVKTIPLSNEFWHAGGLSILGDILAVPIEGEKKSRIVFLHMLNPEDPTQLDCDIERPNNTGGAVALAKLVNGKFVCAVYREVKKKPIVRLDFYVSKSNDIREGFEENADGSKKFVTWSYGNLNLDEEHDPSYQNVNFIEAIDKDAGDGVTRLYMIGTQNTSSGAPLLGGRDLADLFKVEIPDDLFNSPGKIPILEKLDSKQFFCDRAYCNFAGAGGIYVDPVSGLSLYSGVHWRSDDMIRFSEFRAELDPQSVIDKPENAWISLYEDREFGGRRLSVLGSRESSFPDYGKLFVQGGGFDNKASSVKFQIPQGLTYRLYRDRSFSGDRPNEDFIDLTGTGSIQAIVDFKADFPNLENKISSSQYV